MVKVPTQAAVHDPASFCSGDQVSIQPTEDQCLLAINEWRCPESAYDWKYPSLLHDCAETRSSNGIKAARDSIAKQWMRRAKTGNPSSCWLTPKRCRDSCDQSRWWFASLSLGESVLQGVLRADLEAREASRRWSWASRRASERRRVMSVIDRRSRLQQAKNPEQSSRRLQI